MVAILLNVSNLAVCARSFLVWFIEPIVHMNIKVSNLFFINSRRCGKREKLQNGEVDFVKRSM